MQAWEQFLQQQEAELGKETVQKWLRSLKVQRFDACNIYLEAKDSFHTLWFDEHMRSKVQTKLVNGNNKPIKVHLSTANMPPRLKKQRTKGAKETPAHPFHLSFDELDPFCTFDHCIVNQANELTFKLLREIAGLSKQPAPKTPAFNPIFLHGPSGAGKTHLLMSLAHAFRAQQLKVIYVRAETFTDHVVAAIRASEMSTFRQIYRTADVLLVDDVHVFSRKGATQEEFFHTFNTLHLAGKQIILSSHCSPQELQLIEPRLISRFEWGIALTLAPLSSNGLAELLQVKMKALNIPLTVPVQEFLIDSFASHSKALVKALEALVLRLHLDARHSSKSLQIPAVKVLLSDLLAEEQRSAITPSKTIQAVAELYGIRSEDILGKTQTRECALPRQLAMYFCREKLKMPFMKIGDLFSRDHSTVMASVKNIQKSLDQDNREIGSAWHAIIKKLYQDH